METEVEGSYVQGHLRLHSECESRLSYLAGYCLKKQKQAGRWWLTPVILTTQKAESRRIVVQSQAGQIVRETLL
jgi:hypothetical protein